MKTKQSKKQSQKMRFAAKYRDLLKLNLEKIYVNIMFAMNT
jgi:hypothetical protein